MEIIEYLKKIALPKYPEMPFFTCSFVDVDKNSICFIFLFIFIDHMCI